MWHVAVAEGHQKWNGCTLLCRRQWKWFQSVETVGLLCAVQMLGSNKTTGSTGKSQGVPVAA